MVVVHHTACNTTIAVNTFLAEKGPHYMIDTDGQVVKWVQDFLAAWHAGEARWAGMNNVNAHSIGIEIVHSAGTFSEAQYNALLDLLGRLTAAFQSIDKWNIVGHGDIGTNAGGVLGRKSGDPGLSFQWSRLEARRFGLLMAAGPPAPDIYGGFFQASPSGFLRRGDNDSRHHFGGVTYKDLKTNPVIELQQDLKDVGYSVGTPDGDFGEKTHHAVLAFQEHFFAGGRSTKKPDGKVDFATAALIKSVAAAGRP
jgi:N-acetyl-anhydromuramyl-L-alanine amidase AmpD